MAGYDRDGRPGSLCGRKGGKRLIRAQNTGGYMATREMGLDRHKTVVLGTAKYKGYGSMPTLINFT